MGSAHQVFISYSREHAKEKADWLLKALQAGEPAVTAFKDDVSLLPGQAWLQQLDEALAQCERFVVLIGPDGLTRWVGGEVAQILNRHFSARRQEQAPQIIPVLMGDTPASVLGGWLSQFQSVHWPADQKEPPAALLASLRANQPAGSQDLVLPEFAGQCPFVGLEALQADQAPLFFGREADLLACLAGLGERQPLPPQPGRRPPTPDYQRWLSMEGASGSGKSSLLRAGLLPLVAQGALSARTGLDEWVVAGPWLPGDAPLTELAVALGDALLPPEQRDSHVLRQRLGEERDDDVLSLWLRDRLAGHPQRGLLIAIDQFEELFTLTPEPARLRLDALLANAVTQSEGRVLLVSTCRSDYAHRIIEELPALGALKQNRQRSATRALAPLDRAAMARAIQGPARLCGLDVSQVLPAVLEDARDDMAGALPLVQQALRTVWEEERKPDGQGRPGQDPVRELRLDTYDRLDRLAGTLAGQADAVLAALRRKSPAHETGALELLLALAHWQPDGRHTRQHLPLDAARRQAGLGDEARGEVVLNALSPHKGTIRLVVVSDEQSQARVDLIHEALLRSRPGTEPKPYWKTLVDYLEQHRDRQHLRDGLRLAARDWEEGHRSWRLTAGWFELRRYRALRHLASDLEQQFLRASRWPASVSVAAWSGVALAGVAGAFLAGNWKEFAAQPEVRDFLEYHWPAPDHLPRTVAIPLESFTYGCDPKRHDALGLENDACPSDPADEMTRTVDLARSGSCNEFGETEVTLAQYNYFVAAMRRSDKAASLPDSVTNYPESGPWDHSRGALPAGGRSWQDAQAYVEWLRVETGDRHWRLPSEEEWEWAARAVHPSKPGGVRGPYWWGPIRPKEQAQRQGHAVANCGACGPGMGEGPLPVKHLPPNPFGLYGMNGNLWEWTSSAYTNDNKAAPEAVQRDPSAKRVLRGGSWINAAGGARASYRNYGLSPDIRYDVIGFRVCRASPIEPRTAGAAVR